MPEPRVSVLVLARDEAHNLADCLAAVRWADQRVVVVDSRSRDATVEIARRAADVVAVRDFDDFASQRNAALALASGDWVLAIDADERATPALADEIRRWIADPDHPYRGFRVPIQSEILGRRFAFSGTQDDRPLRLFRRDSGRWVGRVHETVELRGPAGLVRNALRHRTIPTMTVFLDKINHYTTLDAEGLAAAKTPYRGRDLALRPLWTFFKLYILKQGFRDGIEGLLFCLLSGVSAAVRAWKHRELERGRRQTAGTGKPVSTHHAPRTTIPKPTTKRSSPRDSTPCTGDSSRRWPRTTPGCSAWWRACGP
ncbi:MAG TPA: glycosyltransferase family 2 protein [Isosphaeraceae bacterium]|nr:glycosyltransferase family 2 protein [Isosphaeraceae bacterium]